MARDLVQPGPRRSTASPLPTCKRLFHRPPLLLLFLPLFGPAPLLAPFASCYSSTSLHRRRASHSTVPPSSHLRVIHLAHPAHPLCLGGAYDKLCRTRSNPRRSLRANTARTSRFSILACPPSFAALVLPPPYLHYRNLKMRSSFAVLALAFSAVVLAAPAPQGAFYLSAFPSPCTLTLLSLLLFYSSLRLSCDSSR
jgi:hypothetical protein